MDMRTHGPRGAAVWAAIAAIGGMAFVLGDGPVAAQNGPQHFTAFAVNTNNGGQTTTLDFTVSRWSTDAEREQLRSILQENKEPTDQLLKALQHLPPVGTIRTPTSVSWDLHYARQEPLPEGGRQIVLATDRPIGFWEARNQPRSIDYPFTVIEVRLDKEGKGEGKILVGTRVYVDKNNNIVLENYEQQPLMLTQVKATS